MTGHEYDLILVNGDLVTMDGDLRVIRNGFVAAKAGRIAMLGPMAELPEGASAAETIDCAGCVVLPGLINAHTHLPMSYFRGMADDLPLMEWLQKHIWPAEQAHLSPEFCYEATKFAAAECIRNGVTCVNDMYIFASDVARAVVDSGLRGYIGEGVINYPTAAAPDWQAGKRLNEALIAEYRDHPLITPTICCHAPYSCTPELLTEMHGLAAEHDLLFHIHLHETEGEPDMIEWGREDESPLHSLLRIGVLDSRLVAAHCVWISDHDIRHMKERGCGVAHCPTSNMKLGSGIAPTHSMLEADLAVGLGTDGAASNNNLNIWEELHLAAIGAKGVYKDASVIPAATALSFATSRGASLLGNSELGVLKVGNHADICTVELSGLSQAPVYPHDTAVYGQLVYGAQAGNVRDTICAGRVLMRDGELTMLDEDELIGKAQAWVDRNFG